MKKITNNLVWSVITCILISCGGDKKDKKVPLSPAQTIAQATEVIGIGKILPKSGVIELSAVRPGIVDRLLVKAGDSVRKGEVLLALRSQEQQLAAAETASQLATQRARNQSDIYQLRMEETKLEELYHTYLTSKQLVVKGSETQEVLQADYSNYTQQQQKVEQAKQQLTVNRKTLQELDRKAQISNFNLAEQQIKAPVDGVIISLDTRVGQSVGANISFGELAPAEELVAECEVDELYAQRIKTGQQVLMYTTGNNTPVGAGVISQVGRSLQDKSIRYEQIGEGEDRRVRRFTVAITKATKELLINDKVECKIQLR
jgi:multidrug resistance efflux pump